MRSIIQGLIRWLRGSGFSMGSEQLGQLSDHFAKILNQGGILGVIDKEANCRFDLLGSLSLRAFNCFT